MTECMTIEAFLARFPGLEDALADRCGEDGTAFEHPGVGTVEVYEEEDDEGARQLLTRYRLTGIADLRGSPVVLEKWPGEELMFEGRTSAINWRTP